MGQATLHQPAMVEAPGRAGLYRLSGSAALLQLVSVFAYVLIGVALGPEPTTIAEHYAVMAQNPLAGLLRDDLTTLVLIALYLCTFPGLYLALRQVSPIATALATSFTFIAVALSFANHSTLSMLHLSAQYAAATSEAQRALYLAAGEAVVATDLWHSSAGFMVGILLQGSGVLVSLVMLRSTTFSQATAYSGLVANGLDLAQHLIHLALPALAATILMVAGPFYLVWFAMLGRDFFRLARTERAATRGQAPAGDPAAGRT